MTQKTVLARKDNRSDTKWELATIARFAGDLTPAPSLEGRVAKKWGRVRRCTREGVAILSGEAKICGAAKISLIVGR